MPLSYLASWKNYFSSNNSLDSSNNQLIRIKDSVGPSIAFLTSFEEISKNPGIYFLSLDPSEWTLQLVSILKFDNDAKPIQLIQKSVKDMKVKSHSFEEFASSIENCASFENMKNPKLDFPYKNILPIPNLLTKTFITKH